MRTWVWTVRVLWTVSTHGAYGLAVSGAVAMFGIWTVVVLPQDVGAPYVLLLFCQLFLASSGFRAAADAGHYDAILVGGATRCQLSLGHWALSASPGIMAWGVVGVTEHCLLAAGQTVGSTLPGLAGLLLASTLPWAVSLATVRFFGGTVWVLAMAVIATSRAGFRWIGGVAELGEPEGFVESAIMLSRFVAVPFMYLVPAAADAASSLPVMAGTLALSAATLGGGMWWIVRRDFAGGA